MAAMPAVWHGERWESVRRVSLPDRKTLKGGMQPNPDVQGPGLHAVFVLLSGNQTPAASADTPGDRRDQEALSTEKWAVLFRRWKGV
jgi:hypothetical protein